MRPISGHLSGAEAASKARALPMTKIPVVVTGSDLVPVLTCRMFIFLTPFIEQEISFFDNEDHSTGILVSRLADDAAQVQGI